MAQRMISALRGGRGEPPEAEIVVVDTEQPDVVRLELDDGEFLTVDRRELLNAIPAAAA